MEKIEDEKITQNNKENHSPNTFIKSPPEILEIKLIDTTDISSKKIKQKNPEKAQNKKKWEEKERFSEKPEEIDEEDKPLLLKNKKSAKQSEKTIFLDKKLPEKRNFEFKQESLKEFLNAPPQEELKMEAVVEELVVAEKPKEKFKRRITKNNKKNFKGNYSNRHTLYKPIVPVVKN
jgi:hypothetical protein